MMGMRGTITAFLKYYKTVCHKILELLVINKKGAAFVQK